MKDITYCISRKCLKSHQCERWWLNNKVSPFENISMFDPYKKGVVCEYYEANKINEVIDYCNTFEKYASSNPKINPILNTEKGDRCPDGESEKDYYPDKRHYKIGTQKLKENEISDCVYVGTCPFQRKKGKPSAMGEDEIAKILKGYITHILWYHDKECGRIADVEIIFASRIADLAHAIVEKIE